MESGDGAEYGVEDVEVCVKDGVESGFRSARREVEGL